MEGLTRAAMEEGGHLLPGVRQLPDAGRGQDRYGGAAPNPDQSWYIAVAPADDPEIVVAVTIERGGFGADAAAPVAARILEKYFKHPSPDRPRAPRRPRTNEAHRALTTTLCPSLRD